MADPQPAALTATVSQPSKAAMVARARSWASVSAPECMSSAPQQPAAAGTTTSKPSALSTRTVASLVRAKNTRATHPCRRPTVPRAGPADVDAGLRSGSFRHVADSFTSGVTRIMAARRGNRLSFGWNRCGRPRQRPATSIGTRARSRPGWVKTSKQKRRKARSAGVRRWRRSTSGRACSRRTS